MNKLIVLIFTLFCTSYINAQTTATDFDISDCFGNPHHLFDELDSGKVVIIDFVMPCGACLYPSKTVYNIINNFRNNNPDRILFYLSDGFGNHNCDTLIVWAANNHIDSSTIIVSTPTVNLIYYGYPGMPKIVVLGGKSHHVFFNKDDGAAGDSIGLCVAIDSALNANNLITENVSIINKINLFPNPVKSKSTLSYSLTEISDIEIEIFTTDNKKVFSELNKNITTGDHKKEIEFEKFSNGNYILRINSEKGSHSYKFTVQ
jgi:hypothetical protein